MATLPDDPQPTPGAPDAPRCIPPRYWWLKRLTIAGLVYVLFLVGVRCWWGYEADRRLQAAINRYHALGQPVLIEDFQPDPIPDEDNAAILLNQAAAKICVPEDVEVDFEQLVGRPRECFEHQEDLRKLVAANQEVFRLVRAARFKSGACWNTRLTTPAFNWAFPNLGLQRRLAKLISVAAVHHRQMGDHAAAIGHVRDALAFGRHVEDHDPSVISHLVRMAIDTLAIRTIEDVTCGLEIANESTADAPQAVARLEIHALIHDLLDERSLEHGGVTVMYAERMYFLDMAVALAEHRVSLSALSGRAGPMNPADHLVALAVGPAWRLDAIRTSVHTTACAEATVAENWPVAQRLVPPPPVWETLPGQIGGMMSGILLGTQSRIVELNFRSRAARRMAAIALAIRLFEVDHGRRPRALRELEGEYLPSVPSDPYSAENREIRYLPDAPSPLLYSVSQNGVDDSGKFVWTENRARTRELDLLFFLNGDRPRPEPD